MPLFPSLAKGLKRRVQELEGELALSLQREKGFKALVERSRDILYRTDLNGNITYISPSVLNISGYTVTEAIGMNMANEVYLHAEERELFLKELREKGEAIDFIAQLKRKDGSVYWVATNAHFYKDEAGAIIGDRRNYQGYHKNDGAGYGASTDFFDVPRLDLCSQPENGKIHQSQPGIY